MSNPQVSSTISRRGILTAAVVGGAGLAFGEAPAYAAQPGRPGPGKGGEGLRLTVLGTTDLHGNVYNWDYFKNAEYDDAAHNDIGIAKAATLIKAMRAERGAETCITLDAGDTIQGTPLAYYYAKIDPITKGAGAGGATGQTLHPMAVAMNEVGYDAAALGNHEFNYGLDILRTFVSQLNHPLLGANAVDWNTGEPVFPPFRLKRINLPGARPVSVGILGLVTPGVAIWDKAVVEGKIRFPGLVEQAKKYVPRLKARGADVVIVSAHSGADTSSSYGDALPHPENAASLIAEEVPGIDAILVGHAHKEIPQRYVTNKATGRQVLLSEPSYWGMRVTVMDLNLVTERGRWRVDTATATLLNSNTAPEDPQVAAALRGQHQQVLGYVNGVIGTCTQEMSAASSRYEDTPAVDFVNLVQAQSVKAALAGTQYADTPVLSIAAPFNRNAAIPAGEVTVRDVAGLYIYDNTLLGIAFSGAQVKAYLEKSAEYFKQVPGPGSYPADAVTNAPTPSAPSGTPDYNYDIISGLDAELTYDIDLTAPVGARIKNLAYAGSPVTDTQQFVVAINNYRQSGGGSFPGVTTATVVDNRQQEIRQLLIDWVTANKTIDPPSFFKQSWKLTAGGTPLTITG